MIESASRRLTIMSFGVFKVPRLIKALEEALARGVQLRIALGDRESQGNLEIDHQLHELGSVVTAGALLLY